MAKIVLGREKDNWKIQVGNKKKFYFRCTGNNQIKVVKEMISKDKLKKLFIKDMDSQIKSYKSYSKNNWASLRDMRDEKEWKAAVKSFKKVIAIGEQLKKDANKDPMEAYIKLENLRNRNFGMRNEWNNSTDLITADGASSYLSSLANKKATKMWNEKNKKTPAKKKTTTKKKKAPAKKKTVRRVRKAPAKKKTTTKKKKAPVKKKTTTKKKKAPAKKKTVRRVRKAPAKKKTTRKKR